MEFRRILKAFRLRAGYGLRQFAELIGDHPSNYAGVESGMRPHWRGEAKLRAVADALGLEEGSRDWDSYFVAARGGGVLPPDMSHLLERESVLILLRTVEERRLTDEELRKVADYVRRGRYRSRAKK